MSLYIDKKFVSLVSTKLERFSQKSEFLWNFRCPICGDSHKNKFKTRGYIYRRKSDLFYTCHNCGTSISLGNFIKTIDHSLYREYQLERYKCESAGNVARPDFSLAMEKPVFKSKSILVGDYAESLESLSPRHAAKHYLTERLIPKESLNTIYYTDDFEDFVKRIYPNYEKKLWSEPRIILPFYDENNVLLGFQGRAILKSEIKYITIKLSDDNKKVFGLNTVDKTKLIYVVEGPLDSLFLKNSIAMMDATLYTAVSVVGPYDYVFVYDNEPRNKDVCRHMQKTIDLHQKICIWPKHIKDKDVNDMVRTYGRTFVQSIIDSNTFSDHRAKLEYEMWKKI